MALISDWFSRKTAGTAAPEAALSAIPQGGADREAKPGSRKTLRLAQRELLYGVIREAMVRAGVLSSSYKFKVLSLDAQGRQYLVMMDLGRDVEGHTGRLADIETQMARSALARHDILVTAVYWRVNEAMESRALRQPASPAARAGN